MNTEDLHIFNDLWAEISNDHTIPQSLIQYLERDWVPIPHMWAKMAHKNRSIFEEGDTNMLIEA